MYVQMYMCLHVYVCVRSFPFCSSACTRKCFARPKKEPAKKRAGALIATQDFGLEALELWGVQHACVLEAFQF